ncbi:hypothetical protein COEREDRAFT_87679 [Coemansia reversa NRRL 1564]|uniref:Uncharacterized protein n=1 Tax=Coemansia reversa (strain ATCC 12441 / NRRL 1564) TaxID=763665 RepID=A0A2G5B9N4_COERN|nr:hypothetical protein COEREDRAFT_87679 [Coemansia reversa NRRL 1564]|eukprot:PIA15721.1 hypothetical protein COEREDRAFT_87679 [Coemansia reversa NRRL 1564]
MVKLHLDASESSAYAEMLSLNDTIFESIHTKPEKLIVAARVKTDREALQHSRILLPLAVFFFIALLSFAYNGSSLWTGKYIRTLIAFHIIVLGWLYILPQVIVNYRAKSGSLIPPAISIYYTYYSMLFAIAMYLLGSGGAFAPQKFDWAQHTATVVHVIQWINYHKYKQE